MVKKANPSRRVHRSCGWFLYVMVKGGEEQCGTDRPICIESSSEMLCELFTESSKAQGQQTGEEIVRIVGAVVRSQGRQNILQVTQNPKCMFPNIINMWRGLRYPFHGSEFRQQIGEGSKYFQCTH